MIICGDLSTPNEKCTERLIHDMIASGIFSNQTILANLEGVMQQDASVDSFWKVYNHESVMRIKNVGKELIFSLANNHTYDYPEKIQSTVQLCTDNGIKTFGLYENGEITPCLFTEDGTDYAVFGHCWNIYTKTNKNKLTDDRVVDCEYEEYYQIVTNFIRNHPHIKVICFLHWNFDLESMPFPAYKQLAHDLIDYGAEAIIGNHAHIPQEVELYRGKVIAYGLGNFYMPDGYFFNGDLKYSRESHLCYVLEVSSSSKPILYKFSTDSDGAALSNCQKIEFGESNLPRYTADEHSKYVKKYKQERKKRFLTPVFKDYDSSYENKLKIQFLIMKISFIRRIRQYRDKKS